MTLDTALMICIIGLFMFFVIMSVRGKGKIFNLFAIACMIWLDIAYITATVGIILSIGVIIWLLIDMFWGKGEREL